MRRIGTIIMLSFWSFLALSIAPAMSSAAVSPACQDEISHLLTYIEKSGCQFYRNGTWYSDTKAARQHVEMKFRYFAGKGKVNSTEDFIKWSGTKSEMSGKPYMVRNGAGTEMPLGQWLNDELTRYRHSK